MTSIPSWRAIAAVTAVVAIASPLAGRAQVSPVGADHVSVGPGAGLLSPVSPTGGFAAAVPLDLPSPRGALGVPLAVRYTAAAQVGAAGAGWDVPLDHVRVSRTTFRRKPAVASPEVGHDHVPERVFVTLAGRTLYMVPSPEPGTYLPFLSDEYMELRRTGAGWTLFTAAGVEHVFEPASSIDGGLAELDLWLLVRAHDRAAAERVELGYEIRDHGCGTEVDLVRLTYGFDDRDVPLHAVELAYARPPWVGEAGCTPLARTAGEARDVVRSRVLQTVRVRSRNNLERLSLMRTIRTHRLAYAPDADTGLPRLVAVDVTGEDGAGPAQPVARYAYGAVSREEPDPNRPNDPMAIRYGVPMAVPLSADAIGAGATSLGSSVNWPDSVVGSSTRPRSR